MAQIKGIDIAISVNTGTAEVPVYTKVGGQRGATLNRSAETMETTSKDSDDFKEFEYGFKEWSLDADGLFVVDDAGFAALEDAYMTSEKVKVQVAMPSGVKYEGMAIISDLPLEFPYDDMTTYSATLQGSGVLAKTEV